MEDLSYVESLLPTGSIAFNAPSELTVEEAVTVFLVVNPDRDSVAARDRLNSLRKSDGTAPGDAREREVPVSPQMIATLTGSAGLLVESRGEQRQRLGVGRSTEWMWRVTPRAGGRQTLTLKLYAEIAELGSPAEIETFEEIINVRVSMGQWAWRAFKDNWEWIFALVVLPGLPLVRSARARVSGAWHDADIAPPGEGEPPSGGTPQLRDPSSQNGSTEN